MQRYLLALTGLALYAGSLGAQDYIDLEAERLEEQRAREQGYPQETAAPVDSYAPDPYEEADAATGVDAYQEVPAYQSSPAPADPPQTQQGTGGQNFGEIYYQLQLLQREVMQLRGQVEEQAHELRQLKQQSLERYVDLDRRIGGVGALPDGESPATPANGNGSSPPKAAPSQAQPGETEAYRSAYALVRNQNFEQAVEAFKVFLQQYPDGKYAPNAHYWLGELYLVISPPDLEAARRAFTLLLEQYPDNSKIPDALYKLGRIYFQKGNSTRAREFLDRVVNDYADSGSSAVGLARDFISENY